MSGKMLTATLVVCVALCAFTSAQEPEPVINHDDPFKYQDCNQLHKAGYAQTGWYGLNIDDTPMQAHCDFGVSIKCTVPIVVRHNEELSFKRSYAEYVDGFQQPEGTHWENFWYGLDILHKATVVAAKFDHYLNVTITNWDGSVTHASYRKFLINDKSTGYVLFVGGFGGKPEDDMLKYSNGGAFYTADHPDPSGCASGTGAGWWFNADNNCTATLPTGRYYHGNYEKSGEFWDGIYWQSDNGRGYSVKSFEMNLVYYPL